MPQAPPAPPSGSPPDEMDVLKLHLREASWPMGDTGGVSDGGVEVEHLEAPSAENNHKIPGGCLNGTIHAT